MKMRRFKDVNTRIPSDWVKARRKIRRIFSKRLQRNARRRLNFLYKKMLSGRYRKMGKRKHVQRATKGD